VIVDVGVIQITELREAKCKMTINAITESRTWLRIFANQAGLSKGKAHAYRFAAG
jgi:hypothetical protein